MSTADDLAKELKKNTKAFLKKKSKSPDTSTNGKNVSWADFPEYDANTRPRRIVRSTPYPNPTKKMKTSNCTPTTLSFDDSSSDDNTHTTFEDTSSLEKPKSKGTKRKRSSIAATSTDWAVEKCNEIKPDKSNKHCDSHNLTIEESSSEDDILSEDKHVFGQFDFDSSSDESFDLNVEKIFKPRILNLKKCLIVKPPVDTDFNNEIEEEYFENGNDQENKSDIIAKPKTRFSKLVKSYINETHCILFLKHPLKLYFNGKLSLSVFHGAVEILGHILKFNNQKEYEIYSPKGQSYLCFETVDIKSNDKESLQKILLDFKVPTKRIKEYLYQLKEFDCVVAIKNLNNNLTNYLSTHVAQHIFPKPIQCERTIEKKLHCLFEFDTPNWKVYNKNTAWVSCLKDANENLARGFSCTMLCGGKSVGKSTLFRYMINSLLNETEKVVCIDLDPGQTEFTITGCVSITIVDEPIFGPNFTHLKTPEKSFFIGDVNLANCVDRYMASLKELLLFCNKNVDKKYPWIVNFMGFSKSFGVDLTISAIKLVCPTTLVQITSSMKHRNYPEPLTIYYVQNYIYSFPIITPQTHVKHNLIVLESSSEEKVEGDFQFEAKHLREMSILSYFSQMTEIGKEITSVTPYSVKMSSIKLHDLSYNKENIPAVMNGNLVALCKTKAEIIDNQTIFDCLGFGIVRGIDRDTDELYLLTPLPEQELEQVNSLIRGNINIPPSLYMTKGRQGLVPYISLGTQRGISCIPKRNFINLKSLLKKK